METQTLVNATLLTAEIVSLAALAFASVPTR
jgi:hypothetical protein